MVFLLAAALVSRLPKWPGGELIEEKPCDLARAVRRVGETGQSMPSELSGQVDCRGQFAIDEYSQDR